jgi:hypothetical protein
MMNSGVIAGQEDLSEADEIGRASLASPQVLGSGRPKLLRAAHLPPLQLNSESRTGCMLFGLGHWKGEEKVRSFGGARRVNAPAQTADQLADDR